MELDDVIRTEYVAVDKTVDDLLSDPVEATHFATRIQHRLDASDEMPIPTILRRLIHLRKNKGLPRIRCA